MALCPPKTAAGRWFNPFYTDSIDIRESNQYDTPPPGYIAIKTGDVDESVFSNDDSWRANPDVHIGWPAAAAAARAGDVLTLPVYYAGAEALEAIQFGLKFDPAVLTLLGPSAGEVGSYNSQCFGLTKAGQGEFRTLWFADPFDPFQGNLQPGTLLFYLSFRLQQTLNAAGLPLDVDDAVLPARAWTPAGREHRVRAAADTERHDAAGKQPLPDGLQVTCFPNPSSGLATFRVTTGQAASLRLALFGPFGNRLWVRDIRVEAGEQDFPAPESAALPAGVYVWKCYAAGRKTSGHWIKL